MAELQLALNIDEREYLIHVLETALKTHRVEEHRTRAPTYRERILEEERLLSQMLTKLEKPPT